MRSQIDRRLNSYDPELEAIILGQVENTTQVFPPEEVYQQINRIEIFNFSSFETSLESCHEHFKNRACEFIL